MEESKDIESQIPIESDKTVSDARNIIVGPPLSGEIDDIMVLR